jgi:DNA-binding response OmpR family regulator
MSVDSYSVLIVEDADLPMQAILQVFSLRGGFQPAVSRSAREALETLKTQTFDLILLDLGLPDMDGLEVCRMLKENPATTDIPIIILTARSSTSEKIAGLEMGADDYIAKPFDPGELIARINVVLRRRKTIRATPAYAGQELSLDVKKRTVTVGNEGIKLTTKEFDLLALMLRTPGETVSRDEIAHLIWDKPAEECSRSLETHVWSLRNKLGKAGKCIETVGNKVGYRFTPPR